MYGEVVSAEPISPSMVRVVLGGGDLDGFTSTGHSDEYINAQFVPPGAPYDVPFDRDHLGHVEAALQPKPRRFTVRNWDDGTKQLTLDFVTHGDVGYAGAWAQRAQPGDRLQFKGPSGGYTPDPAAAWHLLVGDESALPAIAVSLERLSPDSRAVALVVVDGPENEQPLICAGDLDLRWVHRRTAADPETVLLEAVTAIDIAEGPVDLFVHGEAGEVRAIRRHLALDRELDIEGASISPYWRRDHTDEAWRAVKRQWTAEMQAETNRNG
jgi:NADPH-dependent ferric siderophore reductase